MKIAVITPYYDENIGTLLRSSDSVTSARHDVCQIFVNDGGSPHSDIDSWTNTQHIVLPIRHNDAGATPRSIGALSAFSQGFDAVSFLDADNFYDFDHIDSMAEIQEFVKPDVISATRNICTQTGEILFVDYLESNGQDFCDTNCMWLTKKCMPFLSEWIVPAADRLWSDRLFWTALTRSNLVRYHNTLPTVNYCSRWAAHYQTAGIDPPAESVWIARDFQGNLVHVQHKDRFVTQGNT